MSEKFTCPRRVAERGHTSANGLFTLDGPNKDEWRKDRTCSYDGSLHPDVFMAYVRSGKRVGVTDKSYKFYMDEYAEEVRGAKKFYTHHLSEEQGWEFDALLRSGAVRFDFPPPPLFIPGPSTQEKKP